MERTIPELLAPAGNLSCAVTAYASGADAVYCGLSRFNAREGADNFSFDDLSRLAAYAKPRGKRYYLTLNTLLKEDELEPALGEVEKIAALKPDGIIIQDPGLLLALKHNFPAIPLHASTQMGIHNSAGLEAAARLGIERVILERQVDLEELRLMAPDAPVELEVFIHGALCCSLSGMCLFSSWMGGWSGNRGRCKQPCRRRFHTESASGKKQSGFFFSTQDLASVDLLREYVQLGIASLKIEGRLKKEGYIEHVVRGYRMLLDGIDTDADAALQGKAKQELARTYGRRWSRGFASQEDRSCLIVPDNPGISGLLVGELLAVKGKGCTIRLSRPVQQGDRLRLQESSGGEASAFRLLAMKKGGQRVGRAFPGDVVTMFPEEHIAREFTGKEGRTRLFKVGESSKAVVKDPASLPLFQASVKVDIRVELQQNLLVVEALEQHFTWKVECEEAKNRCIDREMLSSLFSATRNPLLELGTLDVDIKGSWFIPPGELKRIRREFWDRIGPMIPGEASREPDRVEHPPELLHKHVCPAGEGTSPPTEGGPESPAAVLRRGRDLRSLEEAKRGEEALLPIFVSESALEKLMDALRDAVTRGVRRFRITSLFQFHLLQQAAEDEAGSLELTVSWPLPVTNSCAVRLYQRLGAQVVQAWLELDRNGQELLMAKSPLPVERFIRGRVPLLVSRAVVPEEGAIVDGRGRRFYLSPRLESPYHPGGLTVLWSDGLFYDESATEHPAESFSFAGDLLPGYGCPTVTSSEGKDNFNLDREWK